MSSSPARNQTGHIGIAVYLSLQTGRQHGNVSGNAVLSGHGLQQNRHRPYCQKCRFYGLPVIAGIVGGIWMIKLGINRALWVFGVAQWVTILGFTWLANFGKFEAITLTEQMMLADR